METNNASTEQLKELWNGMAKEKWFLDKENYRLMGEGNISPFVIAPHIELYPFGELAALAPSLAKEVVELREAFKSLNNTFYMDICRAYNAGKQNMAATIKEESKFISSDDYFNSEFKNYSFI